MGAGTVVSKYSIGVDFGTLSGRAVLVNVSSGAEVAESVYEYSHGSMDETLPDGTKLPPDFALQDPADYIRTLEKTVPEVIASAGIDPNDVIGLGIDFTACTILPVDESGLPLCYRSDLASNPHAWVKLWKHHAAQDEANQLNAIAESRGEQFLSRYGGKISSEWFFPKVWQVLDEAPDVYEQTDRFVEAADWVIMQLTGQERRNSCTAGYKAMWSKQEGYPSKEFFRALDPRLENVVEEKMSTDIYPQGAKAGTLTEAMAKKLGLSPMVAVAVANVDAHVSVPAATITEPGKILAIMGTSTCHCLISDQQMKVEGMCGVVEDGILPGYYGYEAGQAAVGDIFAWFVDSYVSPHYHDEAKKRGLSIHQLLEKKASALRPGESGLLALDWWNGNRSTLVDADLSGLLLGMNLTTKPEEIYRALIEATAFGTRTIIEAFRDSGVPVNEFYACGGLPEKNALLMQIYADVIDMEIKVSYSSQTPALGAAMFGAVAAGEEAGGYSSITEAAKRMARLKDTTFKPVPENVLVYDRIYAEYKKLYDYFGRGENNVMKRLREIRSQVR